MVYQRAWPRLLSTFFYSLYLFFFFFFPKCGNVCCRERMSYVCIRKFGCLATSLIDYRSPEDLVCTMTCAMRVPHYDWSGHTVVFCAFVTVGLGAADNGPALRGCDDGDGLRPLGGGEGAKKGRGRLWVRLTRSQPCASEVPASEQVEWAFSIEPRHRDQTPKALGKA